MHGMTNTHVLIIGVGGLGTAMVHEALERGCRVSVQVRDRSRLQQRLDRDTLDRLEAVHVGDASDATGLDEAMSGTSVVLSGIGAAPKLATSLAAAVDRNDPGKLCWPAGSTNVKADDGVTPNYQTLRDLGDWVEGAYRTHQACIDAIRDAGINYVILCPGRMDSVGHRSQDVRSSVRVDRDAGSFLSYEDAAWVMLEGALTDAYDHQLVSAATHPDSDG